MLRKTAFLSVFSYPKINLALDVLGKTQSGYHEIQTVLHQLDEPADEIILENRTDGEVEINSDCRTLPKDETNTVLKAALLLKKAVGISNGAKIFIKKRIPLMSGLGGGSSNAVAALKALARLWAVKCCDSGAHAPDCLLRKLANQIGMDCVFFFNGGTALGEHFGEKITSLSPMPAGLKFEIIETGVKISSREAYGKINLNLCGKNMNRTQNLIKALHRKDAKCVFENIHNDFEISVFESYPQLREIKNKFKKDNVRILLCGSGGCLVRVSFSEVP